MRHGKSHATLGEYERSAVALSRWIESHLGLLSGLAALRDLGEEADLALDAVFEIREVRCTRFGWQLVDALCASDGEDFEALILRHLPLSRWETARSALWGQP